MAKPNWHYYEAHINLGSMTEHHEKSLKVVLDALGFKTTDIVTTPYEDLEQEDFHTIITTKDSNLKTLNNRIFYAVQALKGMGYNVQRYKIESTIIDSKYEDKFQLL